MGQLWQIELFGWLRVVGTDRVLSRFRSRKAQALLGYLAYHVDRSHPRQQLVELLWPEGDPARGLRKLSVELTSLRHQLEPPGIPAGAVLEASRSEVQLTPAAVLTDVRLFEAALEAAREATSPSEHVEQLTVAVTLYRGELLPGCFDDWIVPERQRLAEAHRGAMHGLVGLLEQLGDAPGALQWARRALAADPLDEENHHCLIRLLVASGQIEEARVQYEQGQHLLLRELGSGLSPEIRALIRELAPAKDRPAATPPGTGRRRRLRSQERGPDQLLPGPGVGSGANGGAAAGTGELWCPRFQPPGAVSRPEDSLPLRLTRFFGREKELALLQSLLGEGITPSECEGNEQRPTVSSTQNSHQSPIACRLLTLTGPGGTGKTRLAVEVAQSLRSRFPGGVWFVSLRDVRDPALISDQVVLALRLTCGPHQEAFEQVVAHLARAPALLLLDNCEHLAAGSAEFVRNLLERLDHLTVLVTSRQCLGLEGERQFRVAPLPVPASQDQPPGDSAVASGAGHWELMRVASVALFVDRAQAVRPEFQLTAQNAAPVAALCQRLEGLPLAIELAAARAGVLSPQQMLARLEQRFELLIGRQRITDPRHRSLRATLDWSYHLLPPELQRFFSLLSIFRGGWTAEAAEAVCEDPGALEHLEALRECSLVEVMEQCAREAGGGEVRFYLLETVREYRAEQLAEPERNELARRHAHYFLALAERSEAEFTLVDQSGWLLRLDQEQDNLRAALSWSVDSVVSGQWLVVSPIESEPKIAPSPSALTTNHYPPTTALELGLRLGAALEAFWCARGHLKEGRELLLRLLVQPGASAPTGVRARALNAAGALTFLQGDLEPARALLEESLAIWRSLGDGAGIATALRHLGWMAVNEWDFAEARSLAEETLAIYQGLNDRRGSADALSVLAEVHTFEGNRAAARALIEQNLAIWRTLGDRAQLMHGLSSLGWTVFQEDAAAGRAAFEESLAAATELDDKLGIAWAVTGLGHVAYWQEDYQTAHKWLEQSLPLWRELDQKRGLISTLCRLGDTRRQQGDSLAACALFEEMLTISREGNWDNYVARSLFLLGHAAGDLNRWEEAAAYCAESLRMSASRENAEHRLHVAWALCGLARVALARTNLTRAARLLGATEALWTSLGLPKRYPDLDRTAAAVRATLAPAEFEAAWAVGRALPLEEAITEALDEAPARPADFAL